MKKGRMLLALFCLALSFANAQNVSEQKNAKSKSTPEKRAEYRTHYLKNQLQLSDEQAIQLRAVLKKHAEWRDAHIRDTPNMLTKELTRIFTPEQMEKYKQLKRNYRKKSKGMHDKNKAHNESDDSLPEE